MKTLLVVLGLFAGGCAMAPSERLTFPAAPLTVDGSTRWYDVNGDGRPDFATVAGPDGRIDRLLYDDDEDGTPERIYRLSDYANADVPHVILLLDSIPYQLANERYGGGDLRLFGPPQKMIAPFPSLTELCYGDILDAPPLPAVIDTQYDPRLGERRSDLWKRVGGYEQPWERRLSYDATFAEAGLTFVDPQAWFAAELSRCKRAVDDSPRRVTIVYVASAASLVCKFGRAGANEVLDGAERLCLQLLYERHGAIKISMMADHGHNFVHSKNVDLAGLLTADGFKVVDSIKSPDDVVVSINGLVTNALVQTDRPAPVAAALVKHEPVELAMYVQGDRVIVQSRAGRAAIERRGDRTRYVPIDADVLAYAATVEKMKAAGDADAEGFATEAAWFKATLDHEWPVAPPRVWAAFHRMVVTPPSLILSFRDGYYCGKPGYEKFITMRSTHGGLNQANSATFVMTMTGRLTGPVTHRDVLRMLEPDEPPRVIR